MKFAICDTHCDTISRILDRGQHLYINDGHVDLKRLIDNNFVMQYFAAWIAPKYAGRGFKRACEIIDNFYKEKPQELKVILDGTDVRDSGISAILSIEGGEALDGRIDNLRHLYNKGIRAMTLTWNGSNEIADGVLTKNPKGLTNFGIKVVNEMNYLGMIVDVSHIAEQGFWDVTEISTAPFIASHSNAYGVKNHVRNLKNDQIEEIVRRKGFIGINFCPDFLGDNPDIIDIIRHFEYMLALNSQDVLGFGADFDGIDSTPIGVFGVQDMSKIINEMLKIGYSDELITKLLSNNALRVTKEILNFNKK